MFVSPNGTKIRLQPIARRLERWFFDSWEKKKPQPPVVEVEILGEMKSTVNDADPDYHKALEAFEGEKGVAYLYFVRDKGIAPFNEEEMALIHATKARLLKDAERYHLDAQEIESMDDTTFYIEHVADIVDAPTLYALCTEIRKTSWPTPEAVMAEAQSFRGDV